MTETTQDPAIRSRREFITALSPHEATWFLTDLAGRFPDVFDEVRQAVEGMWSRQPLPQVEIIYRESWRAEIWDDEIASREGWQVHCAEHGLLGSPPGWAYENSSRAHMVATRHRRKHAGE
jgi:hypothetical protein